MKLKSIKIKNFRSIEEVTLEDCGNLNVIIGRNNAGKSNILMAIDAFFQCLSKGELIILDPPIGESFDYYHNSVENPIEISLFFDFSPIERKKFIQYIISQIPIFQFLVNKIDPEFGLA